MAFLTLEDLKGQIGAKTDQKDVELQTHVDATEKIMRYLIGPSTVETFTDTNIRAGRSGLLVLVGRPIVALTSITSEYGSTVATSGVQVLNASGGVIGQLYGRFVGRYTVVYTAGRSTVDDNHTLAASIIAQHLWRLKNGGAGAAYPGQQQDDLVIVGMGYAIPRRALELLAMEPTPTKVPGIA